MLQFYLLLTFLQLFSCSKINPDIDKPLNPIVTTYKPLIYLIDYLKENSKTIVSWKYNARYVDFKTVHLKNSSGEEIATIDFPLDYYELENTITAKSVILQVENNKGQLSEKYLLDLDKDKFNISLIETAPIKRVLINTNASMPFFYKKGESSPIRLFGVNYIRLRGQESRLKGDHSTFDAATFSTKADYNPYHAETLLRILKTKGFNFVRVFVIGRSSVNPGVSGDVSLNEPFYEPYMNNVIDFIKRAQKYGIYVYLSFGDGELPLNAWYKTRLPGTDVSYLRLYFPFVKNAVDLKAEYLSFFINHIKSTNPLLINSLLAVELQNEYALNANVWPFSLKSGIFNAYWGESYDLANGESRQKLADDGTIIYQNKMVEALNQVDPELLVSEGFFTLNAVGKTPETAFGLYPDNFEDERYPPTFNVIVKSNIDFIDIHIYPHSATNSIQDQFSQNMNTMLEGDTKLNDILSKKPMILGEFGAFYENEKGNSTTTANRMAELANIAMNNGLSGWCYWTFDTFEQERILNLMEQNQEIMGAVSLTIK